MGGGALGRCLEQEGRAFMNAISVPIKDIPESSFTSSPMKLWWEDSHLETMNTSAGIKSASTLISDLMAFRAVRHELFLMASSQSVIFCPSGLYTWRQEPFRRLEDGNWVSSLSKFLNLPFTVQQGFYKSPVHIYLILGKTLRWRSGHMLCIMPGGTPFVMNLTVAHLLAQLSEQKNYSHFYPQPTK